MDSEPTSWKQDVFKFCRPPVFTIKSPEVCSIKVQHWVKYDGRHFQTPILNLYSLVFPSPLNMYFILAETNNCLERWLSLMLSQWTANDISKEEKVRKRPCSASEDQIGSRQRACIIDASVYMMRPSPSLRGVWRVKIPQSSFSLNISLSPLFLLSLCASRPHHLSPPTLWIYITEFSNLSGSSGWTNSQLLFTSLVQVTCFHCGPSPWSPLCRNLLRMST